MTILYQEGTFSYKYCKLLQNKKSLHHFENDDIADIFARIECHYFINKGFFEYDGWILDQIDVIFLDLVNLNKWKWNFLLSLVRKKNGLIIGEIKD